MNQTGKFLSISALALIRGIDIRYLNQKVITINLIYFEIIYKKKVFWIKNRPSGLELDLMGTFCRNRPFALIDHVINFR